jgi:rare lipoprotein A
MKSNSYYLTRSGYKSYQNKVSICSCYGAEGQLPEGQPTAYGDQFSRSAMTVAHKILPCGTRARV